ncbi:hypothetical protein D9M72_643880 [compost metagenome]
MFRQDRRKPEQQRQFTVGIFGEGEADAEIADLLQFGHLRHAVAEGNAALVAHQLEGEDDIVSRDRLSVGPARGRIDIELNERPIVVPFHRLGQQTVHREGFVAGALHQ